jgi:phosphopantetheinyl transferase
MAAFLAPGAAAAPAAHPLLGDVVAAEPGASLVARRVVDPAEDAYLLHHTLGANVSRADPALTGLAIMPMAMSLELLAEAAAALVGGHVVTGLLDVRAHRWLAWGEAPRTLELTAARVAADGPGEHVRVQLRDLGESGADAGPAVVEGTVRLEPGYRVAPARSDQWRPAGRPSTFAPGAMYGEAMFHQPLWQGVHALDVVAPAGAVARLRVLDRAGLLASDPAPAFQLDPVVLDAAGQVIGFWAAEMFDRGRVVFPFRLTSLDVHGPPPPAGTELECVASIETLGEALVRSDIDVLDAGGHCWMRLTGWEDKRFDVPDRFRPLTMPSELPPIASSWETPVRLAGRPGVAARRLDARLPADGALWGPAWARRVLNRAERARFDLLPRSDARKLEWLGARTAAKEAIAHLLRTARLLDPLHADVEIDAAPDGRPVVRVAGLDHVGIDVVVSLAHAAGEAAALAAIVPRGSGAGVGLDVEPLRPLGEGFAQAGLEAPAQAALEAVGADARDEWRLRCWCAKEAAGKALGTGLLPGTPQAPRIAAVDVGTGAVAVDAGGTRILAHTARDGALIVATAVWDGPDGDAHP